MLAKPAGGCSCIAFEGFAGTVCCLEEGWPPALPKYCSWIHFCNLFNLLNWPARIMTHRNLWSWHVLLRRKAIFLCMCCLILYMFMTWFSEVNRSPGSVSCNAFTDSTNKRMMWQCAQYAHHTCIMHLSTNMEYVVYQITHSSKQCDVQLWCVVEVLIHELISCLDFEKEKRLRYLSRLTMQPQN